jgi:hypothetical protein
VSVQIIALPADAEAAVAALRQVFTVIAVRGPYPCRGQDLRVRFYLEVTP